MNALRRMLLNCLVLTMFTAGAHAAGLGTGFTYQGQLNQSGTPFQGTAHFRFSLWDAATAGTQLGASQIVSSVPVSAGIFSVVLNAGGEFSADAFSGEVRWLQVEVCTNASCTTPTLLSPRQPVTGSPYALQSLQTQKLLNPNGGIAVSINPGVATNVPGMYVGKVPSDMLMGNMLDGGYGHSFLSMGYPTGPRKFSLGRASSSDFNAAVFQPQFTLASNTGYVGIGITTPSAPLSFAPSNGDKISLVQSGGGGQYGFGIQTGLIQMYGESSAADIAFGHGTSASFTELMRIKGTGNVGIGTSNPLAKLEVRGNIRMGSNGTEYAASGVEDLRIIRGSLNGAGTGTIEYGSGFTIATEANFIRKITFNTPYSSPPTVTATAVECAGCNTTFCEIVSVTSTYVRVAMYYRSDGSYIGGPFHFISIGPR